MAADLFVRLYWLWSFQGLCGMVLLASADRNKPFTEDRRVFAPGRPIWVKAPFPVAGRLWNFVPDGRFGRPMGDKDRRKNPRIETSNTVSFVCIDEDGNEVREGLGTALNMSLGGIKLVTREPVETPYVILLVIDLEEDVLEVKGKVVFSRKGDGGVFVVGIKFIDTEEKHHRVIRNFVKMYHRAKLATRPGASQDAGPGKN